MSMCYHMANFASLFEYGFNLILLAGVVQEFFLKKKFGIEAARDRFDSLVAAIHFDDARAYKVDAVRDEIEHSFKTVFDRIEKSLLACRVALTLGLALPIYLAFQVAIDQGAVSFADTCDPGVVIAIAVVAVLAWGPVVALAFAFYAHSLCSPVEKEFAEKIRAVARNTI